MGQGISVDRRAIMNDKPEQAALLSVLTTEHFVLQTAYSATISEAAARSTLYVMALSSSLVAMGFLSQSRELFAPFAATVLPVVFLLGLFTVVRLVDTGLESMHYLTGIARIRGFYRTLGEEAAQHFTPEQGRWPEVESPALRLGALSAFLGTTASMIAVINSVVAGAAASLLAQMFAPASPRWLGIMAGAATALGLIVAFLAYQRWRFAVFDVAAQRIPVRRPVDD
jgi:hypothetical protein